MRRAIGHTLIGLLLVCSSLALAQADAGTPREPVIIELFGRAGCSHCDKAHQFLSELARAERLDLRHHQVDQDAAALERLQTLAAQAGHELVAVPAIYARGRLFVGFESAETTGLALSAWIAHAESADAPVGDGLSCTVDGVEACEPPPSTVDIPWIGQLDVGAIGLPLFTIALGLIDGFNPCAMWVLLFVLSMLIHLKSRSRMALIGGTFVVVSGVVYFAFMAAWLNFFLLVGFSRWLQVILGVIALAVASIHIKDFFALQHGISLSIPESSKPGLYRRVREILKTDTLSSSMVAVATLAVMVNMVELLCTAGLPALYTQILTSRGLDSLSYYAYLGLYILAYMLDDAVMLTIAVVTLSHRKLQERGARVLKLISGLVMAMLGLLLIVKPEWLTFGAGN